MQQGFCLTLLQVEAVGCTDPQTSLAGQGRCINVPTEDSEQMAGRMLNSDSGRSHSATQEDSTVADC